MSAVAAARRANVAPAIPDDAAEWLRAHFDWTFGAIWVATERFAVGAETVVAWAERLRAGGARAGLGGKERTWILKQLSDPEQRPTAVERAMARTVFLGRELTPPDSPSGPVAINGIDDAIALLEARLADDERGEHNLRSLLLDDLRVLRGERQTQRDDERRCDEMSAPSAVDGQPTAAVASTATPMHDDKGYQIRDAVCLYCGKSFTSRKYPSGWTSYCSKECGARGRFSDKPGKPMPTAAPSVASEATATAPTHLVTPSEPVRLHLTPRPEPESESAAAEVVAAVVTPEPTPLLQEPWTGSVAVRRVSETRIAPPPSTPSPLLTALVHRLPTTGRWSTAQRERWLRAFTATLDLEIETTVEQKAEA